MGKTRLTFFATPRDPSPFLLLSCRLHDLTGKEQSLVTRTKDGVAANVLVGNRVVPCARLQDEHGASKLLFVFSDLSVRVPGTYKLRFDLMDIESRYESSRWQMRARTERRVRAENFPLHSFIPGNLMDAGQSKRAVTTVWSEAFQVFSPKTYPGNTKVREMTPAQHFVR